jgi:hypothetical protein
MMNIITFPRASLPGVPRLVKDEQKIRTWYDSLSADAQDSWYSLHELSAATGVAMTRLATVLWRCGWIAERRRNVPGLVVWHGPNGYEDE